MTYYSFTENWSDCYNDCKRSGWIAHAHGVNLYDDDSMDEICNDFCAPPAPGPASIY